MEAGSFTVDSGCLGKKVASFISTTLEASNVGAVPLPSYLALGLQSRVWRTVYVLNGGGVAARDGRNQFASTWHSTQYA